MSEAEILAIRMATALSDGPPTTYLSITGDDAFTTLDRVCPADLFVRDGQVRPSVLLDEKGRIIADIYVGQDDEAYLLIAEGMTAKALTDHLAEHAEPGADFRVEDLGVENETCGVHGPYAWELIGEVLGPDLIGLPYLYFYRTEGVFCLRAGKTGEYGYDLLLPRSSAQEIKSRILDKGEAFDLKNVSPDALDHCSLENGFFNVRREGRHGLSPIELGIQWRVSYRKEYVGSEALSVEREKGVTRRATYIACANEISDSDPVWYEGERIGHVLSAGFSPITKTHVALALLDSPYCHAGIDCFSAGEKGSSRPVATVSPPFLVNRSLYVNPQRHSYEGRNRNNLPPLYDG